jgi:hypothetical protein
MNRSMLVVTVVAVAAGLATGAVAFGSRST